MDKRVGVTASDLGWRNKKFFSVVEWKCESVYFTIILMTILRCIFILLITSGQVRAQIVIDLNGRCWPSRFPWGWRCCSESSMGRECAECSFWDSQTISRKRGNWRRIELAAGEKGKLTVSVRNSHRVNLHESASRDPGRRTAAAQTPSRTARSPSYIKQKFNFYQTFVDLSSTYAHKSAKKGSYGIPFKISGLAYA